MLGNEYFFLCWLGNLNREIVGTYLPYKFIFSHFAGGLYENTPHYPEINNYVSVILGGCIWHDPFHPITVQPGSPQESGGHHKKVGSPQESCFNSHHSILVPHWNIQGIDLSGVDISGGFRQQRKSCLDYLILNTPQLTHTCVNPLSNHGFWQQGLM